MHKFEKKQLIKLFSNEGDTSLFERSIRSIRKMAGWFLFNCTILLGSSLIVPRTSSANNQNSIGKSSLVSAWGWASPRKVLLSYTNSMF